MDLLQVCRGIVSQADDVHVCLQYALPSALIDLRCGQTMTIARTLMRDLASSVIGSFASSAETPRLLSS